VCHRGVEEKHLCPIHLALVNHPRVDKYHTDQNQGVCQPTLSLTPIHDSPFVIYQSLSMRLSKSAFAAGLSAII
jgi:hypothetical protein